jgi:hypothetical protein
VSTTSSTTFRHSPSSSISSIPESNLTSISSIHVSGIMSSGNRDSHAYLPPIRCSSPLHFSRNTSQSTLDEHHEYDSPLSGSPPLLSVVPEEPSENGHGEYGDMRPTTPCSVFDRILMPQAFVPTRRAPRPPQPQSWIDLSDDDCSIVDRPAPRSRGVAPSPPAMEDQSSHLEREIMRMLQFNEERDVEARIAEEKKKKRASNASLMGGLWGRLKRTASTAGIRPERPEGSKRTSYFDYFG